MKRLLVAAAVLAAFAFSGAAFGQGYVGGSVGQSDYKVDCDPGFSCDTTDTGYKVFGGYMFMPYLGIEGAWVDLGKATESGTVGVLNGKVPTLLAATASLKASGFALYGVGAYPIGDAAVFGKLGLASIKAKAEACLSGFGCASESETNTDFAWGVGASYHFTKNFGTRLEFERFRGKFTDGEKFDIDLLSLGIQYRF
jgi:OmpA-OmpF porin, OOP family